MKQGNIQVETLRLLRDIQRDTRSHNSDSSNRGGGGGSNSGNGGNNGGSSSIHRHIHKTPNNATVERRIKYKYC